MSLKPYSRARPPAVSERWFQRAQPESVASATTPRPA